MDVSQLQLRRRVQKLIALLRVLLVVFRISDYSLNQRRLPEGATNDRCCKPSNVHVLLCRCGPYSASFACRRQRVRPAAPKVEIRAVRPNEIWHMDTTLIRLLDGSRVYLQAVMQLFHVSLLGSGHEPYS